MITKYHGLSLEELLRQVQDKRVSPIIEELCTRLEDYADAEDDSGGVTMSCPVCEVELSLENDGTADYLKVNE